MQHDVQQVLRKSCCGYQQSKDILHLAVHERASKSRSDVLPSETSEGKIKWMNEKQVNIA